jgi:hypothetical protein
MLTIAVAETESEISLSSSTWELFKVSYFTLRVAFPITLGTVASIFFEFEFKLPPSLISKSSPTCKVDQSLSEAATRATYYTGYGNAPVSTAITLPSYLGTYYCP